MLITLIIGTRNQGVHGMYIPSNNPTLFTIRDPRGCAIFVLSAVIVFWLGVLIGFVAGRV
jgi:hypothetical protein